MLLRKAILHIDCNAFFVSCERLKSPELQDQLVIVGGASKNSQKGVVTSASYGVRQYGVYAGMPLYKARKLCPQAKVVAPDHQYYQEISDRLQKVLRQFSNQVEMTSIDEGYLDLTGLDQLWGDSYLDMLQQLEQVIKTSIGVPVSMGLADNKVTAKIAAGVKKPGITIVSSDETRAFLGQLPIQDFPGIGGVTARKLALSGVITIADLQQWSCDRLQNALGSFGEELFLLINGYDDRPVNTAQESPQSISHEQTFLSHEIDFAGVSGELRVLTAYLLRRLRNLRLSAKELRIKVRFTDFTTYTKTHTLPDFAQYDHDLFPVIKSLVEQIIGEHPTKKGVRLLGITVAQLQPIFGKSLFTSMKVSKLQTTIDTINNRYQDIKVFFGS